MQKIRNSSILKILCYILIPILVAAILLSTIYISMRDEFGYLENGKGAYIQTEEFGHNYLSNIIYEVQNINERSINETREIISRSIIDHYDEIEDNVYYNRYDYDNRTIFNYIKYIILKEDTNSIYTNIQFDNYQNAVNNVKTNEIYWIYENGNIITNIEKINSSNAKYVVLPSKGIQTLEGYKVYTYIDTSAFKYSNIYSFRALIFDMFKLNTNASEIIIPACSIALIIIGIYLLWSIGHSKKEEGIHLNSLDRFPYELLACLCVTIIIICTAIVKIALYDFNLSINFIWSILQIDYLVAYSATAIISISTIKRLKAKEFWHTFLTYKIYKKCKNKIVEETQKVLDKSISQRKLITLYIAFIIISSMLGITFIEGVGFSFILLLLLWIYTLYKLLEYNKKLNNIKESLKEVYNGNNNVHIDTEVLRGSLKELAIYVNDIANGFSNAVEESLKSERLKTELITNVSHDIKTPLTSIINYVDLIKQENIEDEKIQEYIKVLDQKSQRLKKLTEDLIEASKASSGNVKLNIESIDLKELLNQVIGEFEDRFNEKKLIIETNITESETKINADNKYMYRIIENLFSNIAKYSMENTRVYINLINKNNEITIEMKNVSKNKLNISSDELMQRFVRGDRSRFTEGSGLGLSIAKSLTELQEGVFDISIDGDLFKAELKWRK